MGGKYQREYRTSQAIPYLVPVATHKIIMVTIHIMCNVVYCL